MPVIDVKHPLVKHKVGLLRANEISTKKFRDLPFTKYLIDDWRGSRSSLNASTHIRF